MTDIEEVLARVHELDQAATYGPWEASQDSHEHLAGCPPTMEWLVGTHDGYEQIIDWGNHGTRADAELIAEYRTLAPRMAKALQTVLTCAQDMLDDHSDTSPYSKGIEDMAGTVKHIVQEALRDDHL